MHSILIFIVTIFILACNATGPFGDVLGTNFKVIQVQQSKGRLYYTSWTPSEEDLKKSSDYHAFSDYIETHTNIMYARNDYLSYATGPKIEHRFKSFETEFVNATVEVAIVCDKALSEKFGNDLQLALNYFSGYMWKINLAFQTLKSSVVQFRITSVVLISTSAGQPFIENARNENGTTSYNRILPLFADYMYEQIGKLPQFDLAMSLTGEPTEWWGGLAYVGETCHIIDSENKFIGVLSMSDDANYVSMDVAQHEIGHVLGAHHDEEIEWCNSTNYIMSGGRYFFSPCSDIQINQHLRSSKAICAVNVTIMAPPAVDLDYGSLTLPTMLSHCHRMFNSTDAFIEVPHLGKCVDVWCAVWRGNTKYSGKFNPPEHTPCSTDGKTCFRGSCVDRGHLITNSGSNLCMRSSDKFGTGDHVEMVDCLPDRTSTPLDRFRLSGKDENITISTVYSIQEFTYQEHGEKCFDVEKVDGSEPEIRLVKCTSAENTSISRWSFRDIWSPDNEKILWDDILRMCVKQNGNRLQLVKERDCNSLDPSFLWRLG